MPEGRLTRHVRSPRLKALRLNMSPLMRHSGGPFGAAEVNMEAGPSRIKTSDEPAPRSYPWPGILGLLPFLRYQQPDLGALSGAFCDHTLSRHQAICCRTWTGAVPPKLVRERTEF